MPVDPNFILKIHHAYRFLRCGRPPLGRSDELFEQYRDGGEDDEASVIGEQLVISGCHAVELLYSSGEGRGCVYSEASRCIAMRSQRFSTPTSEKAMMPSSLGP